MSTVQTIITLLPQFKMYKISVVILMVAVFCTAIPVNVQMEAQEGEHEHVRVTCDILSGSIGGISVGHAACATHCIFMGQGYNGGRCIDGVCHCRS